MVYLPTNSSPSGGNSTIFLPGNSLKSGRVRIEGLRAHTEYVLRVAAVNSIQEVGVASEGVSAWTMESGECMGYGVWGVGCGEWGVGSGEWGVGCGEWGVGCGVWGVGSGEWGVGCGEWGVGCGEWGVGCVVWGIGNGVWGMGYRYIDMPSDPPSVGLTHFQSPKPARYFG